MKLLLFVITALAISNAHANETKVYDGNFSNVPKLENVWGGARLDGRSQADKESLCAGWLDEQVKQLRAHGHEILSSACVRLSGPRQTGPVGTSTAGYDDGVRGQIEFLN